MKFDNDETVKCIDDKIARGAFTIGKKYLLIDVRRQYSPSDKDPKPTTPNWCTIQDDEGVFQIFKRGVVEEKFA